jgi:hypothetical protein
MGWLATRPISSRVLARDRRAHRPERRGRGHHVLAFEQAGDARLAHRQRAEHQRAVADRLVARHADAAGKRPGGQEAARARGG